jgi:hypothetical protein
MITKFITTIRPTAADQNGTGTFADGAFPLTAAEQRTFDRQYSLRKSYGNDHLAAREIAKSDPAFA